MRNSKKIQNVLIATLIALVSFSACSHDEKEKLIVTRQDSTSYSLGVTFAKRIPQNLKDNNIETVDFEYFLQGIVDYFDKETSVKLTDQEIDRIVNTIIGKQVQEKQEKFVEQNKPNIEKGKTFLEKNKENSNVIELKDGLQYRILDMGWGKMSPIKTDNILISFKVYNTKYELIYDSQKKSEQTKIYLGSAIPALQEVLPKIKTGGSVRIFTSHEYAYGSTVYEQDLVKPYETLIFDVTLNKIILSAERLAEWNKLVEQEQNQNQNNQ
ncbi:MAG: FKBP-type peptidyl-prolyl cis-trans isomerase [Bacteroidales bacterium]|nr:FKBP-type peptidyl-prolyl cis-trans isomerase [Bacteroidales bacterium]